MKSNRKPAEHFFHHVSEQRTNVDMLNLDSWAISQDNIAKYIQNTASPAFYN